MSFRTEHRRPSILRTGVIRLLMLAAFLSAGAAAAAPTLLPAGVKREPTPAWVETTDIAKIAAAAPLDGVAYVLVEDQLSLLGAQPEEYRRLVFDVVERDGLEDAGRMPIDFQPDYQQIRLHGLVVIRDGEGSDRRDDVRAEMLRREQNVDDGVLDGEVTIEMFLPDVRVGDRLDLSYSIVGRNPVFGDEYHSAYSGGYGQGTGSRRILAFAPSARQLHWRMSGVGYTKKESTRDGVRRLALEATPLAPVVGEDEAPDWFDGYGHVDISTSADWGAVAEWAARLFVIDAEARRSIGDVAAELALADRTPAAALSEALAYVQREVRYVSLSLGESSHAPANPALTLARRYGDCKDKALLLVGLLREASIEAEPVLVSSGLREHVAEHLPTPLAFDHAIVRARIDGKWQYIDPTRTLETGGPADREPVEFGAGLPVAAGVTALAEFPAPAIAAPSVEVVQEIRVEPADEEGKGDDARPLAEIRVTTRYRHGPANDMRARFRASGPEQVGRDYLSFMEALYRDVRQVQAPRIEDAAEDNVVSIHERYLAPFEPEEGSPAAIGNLDLKLFQIADWVPAARDGERHWPLALGGPESGVQEIRMVAEGGWDIEPAVERIENEWFRFERRIDVDGDTLSMRGEWHRLRDAIPAADYAAARTDLHRVRDLLSYPVLLGGGGSAVTLDAGALAWPAAATLGLVLLLTGLWPLRQRSDIAGMLFEPRATTERVVEQRGIPSALLLMVLTGVLGVAFEVVPVLANGSSPDWGPHLLEALLAVPQDVIFVAVLLLAFRLLQVPAGFRPLFVAGAWAAWPMLIVVPLAMLAAGPAIIVLAEGATYPEGPTWVVVSMLAAVFVLAFAGIAWAVVSSVIAVATAARTRVTLAIGALFITFVGLFFAIFVLALGLYGTGLISLP